MRRKIEYAVLLASILGYSSQGIAMEEDGNETPRLKKVQNTEMRNLSRNPCVNGACGGIDDAGYLRSKDTMSWDDAGYLQGKDTMSFSTKTEEAPSVYDRIQDSQSRPVSNVYECLPDAPENIFRQEQVYLQLTSENSEEGLSDHQRKGPSIFRKIAYGAASFGAAAITGGVLWLIYRKMSASIAAPLNAENGLLSADPLTTQGMIVTPRVSFDELTSLAPEERERPTTAANAFNADSFLIGMVSYSRGMRQNFKDFTSMIVLILTGERR